MEKLVFFVTASLQLSAKAIRVQWRLSPNTFQIGTR